MRRLNDTHEARVTRMLEFYTIDDLSEFKEQVVFEHDIDEEKAFVFLDMQTRTDYFVCDGRNNPKIEWYIEAIKRHYGKE